MIRNKIVVHFLPGSRLGGGSVRLPFSCRFRAGLPGSEAAEEDPDDEYTEEDDVDEDEANDIYNMRIERRGRRDRHRVTIVETNRQRANVSPGDELRVDTSFDTNNAALRPAIRSCWLSADGRRTDDEAATSSVPRQDRLLEDGCPSAASAANVTVFSSASHAPAFAFRVTERHLRMEQIYVFCVIGLCVPSDAGGGLNNVATVSFALHGFKHVFTIVLLFMYSVWTRSSGAPRRPPGRRRCRRRRRCSWSGAGRCTSSWYSPPPRRGRTA